MPLFTAKAIFNLALMLTLIMCPNRSSLRRILNPELDSGEAGR